MNLKACRSPMNLVQDKLACKDRNELLLLDGWEPPRKRPLIRKVLLNFIYSPKLWFNLSYNGLIVLDFYNSRETSKGFHHLQSNNLRRGFHYKHRRSDFAHENTPCEELIMAFDIKTEEFTVMPHPGPTDDCYCHGKHSNMSIFMMDGHLSFVQSIIVMNALTIYIWTLQETATRFWKKSHIVIINIDDLNIGVHELRDGIFGVMAAGNGVLLLQFSNERFYAGNLELGTVKRIGRKCKCPDDMSAYFPSFVSLRNCKSEIRI